MTDSEFSGYVHSFHGTVFRLAYSYLRNREDAEDISQEVFMKLYSSSKRFNDEEHLKRWLILVTSNLCKDVLRSARFRLNTELTEDIPFNETQESGIMDYIRRLKPDYSAVIYLFYYEDMSVKEIASALKLTQTAVTSRLCRGRNQLREMLLKEEYYETKDN